MNRKYGFITAIAIIAVVGLAVAPFLASSLNLLQTAEAAPKNKIEGTEGGDFIVGTPGDDKIDSKGGGDLNFGDAIVGDGSGNDKINSGDGNDINSGDSFSGDGSGNDKIKSGKGNDINIGDTSTGIVGSGDDKINAGQGDDILLGNGGADKFQCGSGEDTVTDFNEAEGDKATGNCENV